MGMVSIETITSILNKLSHSEHRIPHTYAYDYIKLKCNKFKGSSRCEISQLTDLSKLDLYVLSLMYVLHFSNMEILSKLDPNDFLVCKECYTMSTIILNNLN
jgi:hypothetical protein